MLFLLARLHKVSINNWLMQKLSRARDGLELVGGTRRRLYSKEVAGLGPGPRRRAGAMPKAHGAQEGRSQTDLRYNLLDSTDSRSGLYLAEPGNKLTEIDNDQKLIQTD